MGKLLWHEYLNYKLTGKQDEETVRKLRSPSLPFPPDLTLLYSIRGGRRSRILSFLFFFLSFLLPQHKICIAKGCLHHIHFVIHTGYVAVSQSSHLSADILKFALRLCCCCCCCCYLFRLHLCQSPVALAGKPAECPTVSCHPPLPSAPPCSLLPLLVFGKFATSVLLLLFSFFFFSTIRHQVAILNY